MKNVGGAITTVLVASIVAAVFAAPVGASSAGITAGAYPATLQGNDVGGITLGIGGTAMECETEFSASLSEASPSVASSSVSNYCAGGFGYLKLNDCKLEVAPAGLGAIRIGPAECGPADLAIYGCAGTFTVPAQTIDGTFENVGSGKEAYFLVNVDEKNATYTSNNNNFCASKGTHENLQIAGQLKVTAEDAEEASIGTSAFVGNLFLAGDGGEAGEPRLDAYEVPTEVAGERLDYPSLEGEITLVDFPESEVNASCEGAAFDGGILSEGESEPTLAAALTDCWLGGLEAEVDMNGCEYAYSEMEAVEVGALYEAAVDLACGEGAEMEINAPGCLVKVPPQSLGGSNQLASGGAIEGEVPMLGQIANTGGVEYSTKGFGCFLLGLGSNGAHEGGSTLLQLALRGVSPA